jgi:hypothetical protein
VGRHHRCGLDRGGEGRLGRGKMRSHLGRQDGAGRGFDITVVAFFHHLLVLRVSCLMGRTGG